MKKLLFGLGAISDLFGWIFALEIFAISFVGAWIFSEKLTLFSVFSFDNAFDNYAYIDIFNSAGRVDDGLENSGWKAQ